MPRKMSREYQRNWYRNHAGKVCDDVRDRKNAIKAWYREEKKKYVCARCGESDPVCIDFHKPGDKSGHTRVSIMVQNGVSKQKILDEIKKCTPLCCNCHRKEHIVYRIAPEV